MAWESPATRPSPTNPRITRRRISLSSFASGRWNDPLWLSYPAYDLPPLPKYLIGAALKTGGYPTPGPLQARRWYLNTSSRFDPPGGMTAAHLPIAVVGAVGCAAVYGLGCLAFGNAAGYLAAGLLMLNPLYSLHARRAMSDVPCEAFLEAALCLALWSWTRSEASNRWRTWLVMSGAGCAAGLSLLSKMSGMLFFPVISVWLIPMSTQSKPMTRTRLWIGMMGVATLAASATVLALNPFLTTQPAGRLDDSTRAIARLSTLERVRMAGALRLRVSADQQEMFPHNAVTTWKDKTAVALVQGFGRFGPFGPRHSDSTIRFDARQDWGALIWFPWVLAGVGWAWRHGHRQRDNHEPPTAWAVLAQFGTTLVIVTAYLPMAWDRYLLPMQAPASLIVAGAAAALARKLWSWSPTPCSRKA